MRKPTLLMLVSFLVAHALTAAAADVTVPIRQFIDGFNTGDTKSVYAAYASGDVMIVDEFAPHRWYGANAPQAWVGDYEKHAQATGVSDGQVKYGPPTRTEIEGDVAYVIIPCTYLYKEHGKSMIEKGEMTFVLQNQAGAWKINAWTWSGEKPHASK